GDTADADGTYGPYTMTSSQVIRVWDSWLTNGVRKYFAVKPSSGNADLGMALHNSASGTFLYQGRSNRVVEVDSAGAGGDEFMNYQASINDWMGLVVWNNGGSTTTTFYLYTDTTAPTGSISINSGSTYANSTSVTLNLTGSDAQTGVAEMHFLNAGYSWSAWEPFAASKGWTLPSGDGTKLVYVQFRNNAGMISSTYGDSITLDTVAPTGSIVINGGDPYALSTSVTLSLSASDAMSGVAEMHVGNAGGGWEPWEPYATSKPWNLLPGDGSKSVWVQYTDQAGNISIQYGDGIVLDILPPTGSILIDGGATFTNSTSVSLALSAGDAGSGVDHMRFLNEGSSWSGWEPYAASKSWTLLSGDGTKTVYVQYRDHAGRISTSYSDSIILDTTPPSGSILIEGGAVYATSSSVTLNLSATDSLSGVADLRFSNNGSSWVAWEPYASTKGWTLDAGDGTKTVYVEYRDNAGNSSSSNNDTIVLDTAPPSSSATSPATTRLLSFAVSWSGSDGLSGVESYDVQYRVGSGGAWMDWLLGTTSTSETFGPASPVSLVRGETYYFRVRAHDFAGNVEAYPSSPDTSTYVEDVVELFLPIVVR
ncbi:MAG: fibronectin type III domain-containing protein, partial [Anaerolineales bacterium]|nr:fibronectin type III domain-containing protein [Anaerolineales bacterium]